MRTGFGTYLCERGEQIGPFHSRQDAERFLILMEMFGTSREGIEIVELDCRAGTGTPRGCQLRSPLLRHSLTAKSLLTARPLTCKLGRSGSLSCAPSGNRARRRLEMASGIWGRHPWIGYLNKERERP